MSAWAGSLFGDALGGPTSATAGDDPASQGLTKIGARPEGTNAISLVGLASSSTWSDAASTPKQSLGSFAGEQSMNKLVALAAAVVVAGCGSTAVSPVTTGPATATPTLAGPSAAVTAGPVPSEAPLAMSTPAPGRPILGHTIAFTFEGALYTAKGDGAERTLVTDFPGTAEPYASAFWSPAGDRLIIRMEEPAGVDNGGGYVFAVDPDGSNLTNLSDVSGSHYDAMPGWSPDGTEIVYAARKPGDSVSQLYIMSADGSAPRKVLETDYEVQYPAWSSTGTIAFTGVIDGGFELFSVRPDGSSLTQLTTDPSPDNWPTWSPDGSRIAFFTARDGQEGVWVMNADGSDSHFLVLGGEPNWSPHGDEITFDCGDAETAIICAIHPDGTDPVHLFDDAGFPVIRP